MSVYVDGERNSFGRMIMCHMWADSVSELLSMADTIGLQRKWFQPLSFPHFDVSLTYRAKAVTAGAIEVESPRRLGNQAKTARQLQRGRPKGESGGAGTAIAQGQVMNP